MQMEEKLWMEENTREEKMSTQPRESQTLLCQFASGKHKNESFHANTHTHTQPAMAPILT